MEAGKCEDEKVAKKCMETCDMCGDEGGQGVKCKDKMPAKKCIKMMEAGKCEDKKIAKQCKKTCDMCEDGPKKSNYWFTLHVPSSYLTSLHQLIFVCTSLGPFELIDHNGDGNITRDEWQEKIELAMEKVMYVTNATFNESLYDDIWETLDCNNATALDIEVKSLKNSFCWTIW